MQPDERALTPERMMGSKVAEIFRKQGYRASLKEEPGETTLTVVAPEVTYDVVIVARWNNPS